MSHEHLLGSDLLNELAEVLPIPMNCRAVSLHIACDSAPVLHVETILTDVEADGVKNVLERYELRKIKDPPVDLS